MGPSPWNPALIEKHTAELPFALKQTNPKIILVIRNPYDRIASFYRYHADRHGAIPFSRWMQKQYKWNVHDSCLTVYGSSHPIIRMEHMQEDMASHGIDIQDLQKRNASKSPPLDIPIRFVQQINRRYASDFKAGNYKLR